MTYQAIASGWGRSQRSLSTSTLPKDEAELVEAVTKRDFSRGALVHGMRRSYGDSSTNSGGLTIDLANFNEISIEPATGIATVGAGATIAQLEVAALRQGFFPPVVPGTGFVSIGGAIASDIHGKSHHKTGSFANCLRSIRLLYSDGSIRDLQPEGETADHFWATVGGMGLTGVTISAQVQLRAIAGDRVEAEEVRVANLDQMIDQLGQADGQFEHTVAWIDLSGDFRGRGLVSRANYATRTSTKASSHEPKLSVPRIPGRSFINPATVRVFNELWFRKPLKNGTIQVQSFMHPLDGVGDWNRMYGSGGLLQYQFVIDDSEVEFLAHVLATMRQLRAASFLGVLKRFGEGNQSPLSFPKRGWTLALDFPVGLPGLAKALHQLDDDLAERGGRVYLTKDSRLRAEHIATMYPRIDQWRAVRNQMDPLHLWQSDQSRRLQLC